MGPDGIRPLIFVAITCLLLLAPPLRAGPPDTLWTRSFGVPDLRTCSYSVRQTPDGGFIITGWTNAWYLESSNFWDVILLRLDPSGNELWRKTYGGLQEDWGSCVRTARDNGFIICGRTNSFGPSKEYWQVYLVKTDSLGSALWEKEYAGGRDFGCSVESTSDGGYVVVGSVTSMGDSAGAVYLLKTDSLGNAEWTKTYRRATLGRDVGYSIQLTADGGYVIAGTTGHTGDGMGNVYLVKTDAQGDLVWDRVLSGREGRCVRQTKDGGYVVTGWTDSDMYLAKTDTAGQLIWERSLGSENTDQGWAVDQLPDGGFVVGGMTMHAWQDFCLVRTDSVGTQLWLKYVGGPYIDQAYDGCLTADGGYILTGWSQSIDTIGTIYTVRLGSVLGIEDQPPAVPRTGWQVYPNPASSQVRIQGDPFEPGRGLPVAGVVIYDVSGTRVRTLRIRPGSSSVVWDGCDERNRRLPGGTYLVLADGPGLPHGLKVVLLR